MIHYAPKVAYVDPAPAFKTMHSLKVVPERFDAEELAIRFVSLMLRRFSDTDPLSSEQIDLLNPDHEDLSLAYEDLRKRVEDALDSDCAYEDLDPDADRRARLLGNLKIRLLINTIALGLIPLAPNNV